MAFNRGIFAGNSRDRDLACGSKGRTLGPQTSPRHFVNASEHLQSTGVLLARSASSLTFPRVIAERLGVRSPGAMRFCRGFFLSGNHLGRSDAANTRTSPPESGLCSFWLDGPKGCAGARK